VVFEIDCHPVHKTTLTFIQYANISLSCDLFSSCILRLEQIITEEKYQNMRKGINSFKIKVMCCFKFFSMMTIVGS
jgi:hypothetical protein